VIQDVIDLISQLRIEQEKVKILREKIRTLRDQGYHSATCFTIRLIGNGKCNCGWTKILADTEAK